MARKKRVSKNARKTTIWLSPADGLVLDVIEKRRQDRNEGRDSPSEIVSDALWKYLVDVEKMPPEQIHALLPEKAAEMPKAKVTTFPNKGTPKS